MLTCMLSDYFHHKFIRDSLLLVIIERFVDGTEEREWEERECLEAKTTMPSSSIEVLASGMKP